MGNFLD